MQKGDGISRRGALKRMGVTLASALVASAGLSSLASCADGSRTRTILYFTGTGNCLYVARQLSGVGGQLLSIPQLVKQGRYDIEADEVGLVYPIYGHMPPNMVREFIKKARIKAKYKFAVLTYGNRKCNAVEIWDGVSRQAGCPFDYITTMIMVDNWLPNFDMVEQMKKDKGIPASLQRISNDLATQRHWIEPVTQEERDMHQGFMAFAGLDQEKGFLMRSEKIFAVTRDSCVGCGVCVDVCPRGNYSLGSRGVSMEGDCEVCLACIQNCPQKAIRFRDNNEYALFSRGELNPNARYRNEHVSLWDIKCSNKQ